MLNDKSRITIWLRPNSQTESKYGCITNYEWLRKECMRFNEYDHRSGVYRHPEEDLAALFYNDGFFENGQWVEE